MEFLRNFLAHFLSLSVYRRRLWKILRLQTRWKPFTKHCIAMHSQRVRIPMNFYCYLCIKCQGRNSCHFKKTIAFSQLPNCGVQQYKFMPIITSHAFYDNCGDDIYNTWSYAAFIAVSTITNQKKIFISIHRELHSS